ncbi:hypothetical protein LTR15_005678 [Elasticomyces elasticus]|nr:hypothetical protein LTR15_005678 [Elasticomyces elasticus]
MDPRTITNTAASQDPYNEKRFGYRSFPYQSASSHPECDDTCDICVHHYLSFRWQAATNYKQVLSDADAKGAIHGLLQSTNSNLETVKSSIVRYGDAIIRRWKKKTTVQRKTLLLQAKPNMFPRRYMIADLREQHLRQPKLPLLKDHDVCLLPLIDLPTLSESPHNLLSLLHARTQNHPAAWAAYDSEQLNFQFLRGLIQLSYNPHGVSLGPNYGTLVPYNKTAIHCGDIGGFPRAFAVLQAQKSLSKLLRAIVELILVPEPTEGNHEWQKLATTNFQVPSKVVTPFYDAPPELSITAIANICTARYDAARRELDKLQTEPYHLRDFLATIQESQFSRIDLTDFKRQSLLVELVVVHHSAVECWMALQVEAAKARHTCTNSLVSGVAPSADIDLAVRKLQRLLMNYNDKVSQSMMLSAGMLLTGTTVKDAFRLAPVVWAADRLSDMVTQKEEQGVLNSTQLLRFIGDHLPKHMPFDGFGRSFRQLFNDAIALDQTLQAMRLHRPRIRTSSSAEIVDSLSGQEKSQYYIALLVMKGHGHQGSFPHSELARPLPKLLGLPSPNKVNKDSLEHFDAAHLAMSEFWGTLKKTRIELYRQHNIHQRALIGIACCPASEEYQEILTATREDLEGKVRELENRTLAEKPAAKPTSNLQPLQTTWGPVLAETVSPATPKEKPKTRPADVEVPHIENLQIEQPEEQPAEQRFIELTKQKSLDLFQRMYTPAACAKGTASVRWRHFVAALSDAGCTSADGPGSSLKFVLTGWGTESVCIHKGHPDDMVNPIALGDHGRSFAERWGWCYDTFKLRG